MFEQYYVPLVFNKLSQVVIFGIAVCLCAISFMACFKLKLGLNQNVGFINGSDLYNYFEVLFDYGPFRDATVKVESIRPWLEKRACCSRDGRWRGDTVC